MQSPWSRILSCKGTTAANLPWKVKSCGWREESPPQDFSISRRFNSLAILNIRAVVFISPNLAGLGCRREYRHDKNTAYSGSLDARRNNQQQIGLTIIRTICCLYNLLPWLSVVKTIYRQNNLSLKLSIDSSTYQFVELSNCRKNNCYVIKGKSRHLISLPQ